MLNCEFILIIPVNKTLLESFSALQWRWTGLDLAMLQSLPLEDLWGTREKVMIHKELNVLYIACFTDLR